MYVTSESVKKGGGRREGGGGRREEGGGGRREGGGGKREGCWLFEYQVKRVVIEDTLSTYSHIVLVVPNMYMYV